MRLRGYIHNGIMFFVGKYKKNPVTVLFVTGFFHS